MHVRTEQFQWQPERKSFVAEASDFGKCFGFSQVSGNEIGIFLISARTQKTAGFKLVEKKYDVEGDLKFWRFLPISEDIARHPKLKDVSVIIFND